MQILKIVLTRHHPDDSAILSRLPSRSSAHMEIQRRRGAYLAVPELEAALSLNRAGSISGFLIRRLILASFAGIPSGYHLA